MKVGHAHLTDRRGVSTVQQIVVNRLDWIFREQPVSDFGIDAQIEVIEDGQTTGRLIAVRVKSGESYFREQTATGFLVRGKQEHLRYWLGHTLPVIVVICRPDSREAYWEQITTETTTNSEKQYSLLIPRSKPLSRNAKAALKTIAFRSPPPFEVGVAPSVRRGRPPTSYGTQMSSTEPDCDPVLNPVNIHIALQAVKADPNFLASGHLTIGAGETSLTVSLMATKEDLAAVLITAGKTTGVVVAVQAEGGTLVKVAQFPLSLKYDTSLPAFFVFGETVRILAINHTTQWGTGVLLRQQSWYRLDGSESPRCVLRFPLEAHVVGWGLKFDRRLTSRHIETPTAIRNGQLIIIAVTVAYFRASLDSIDKSPFIEATKIMAHRWDSRSKRFHPTEESEISPEVIFDVFGEDDAGIVARNLGTIVGRALIDRDEASQQWVRDLTDRIDNRNGSILRAALDLGRADF